MNGTCEYCGLQFKNVGSHKTFCEKNPNKIKGDEIISKEETVKEVKPGKKDNQNVIFELSIGDVRIGLNVTNSSVDEVRFSAYETLEVLAGLRREEEEVPEETKEGEPERIITPPADEVKQSDLSGDKTYTNLMDTLKEPKPAATPAEKKAFSLFKRNR